jgi:hypothetical protein
MSDVYVHGVKTRGVFECPVLNLVISAHPTSLSRAVKLLNAAGEKITQKQLACELDESVEKTYAES